MRENKNVFGCVVRKLAEKRNCIHIEIYNNIEMSFFTFFFFNILNKPIEMSIENVFLSKPAIIESL